MSAWHRLLRGSALAAATLLGTGAASAGSGSNCNLVLCVTLNASDLAFGNYAPLSGQVTDSTSTISVSARLISNLLPTAISYTLSLGPGTGTIADRTLASGSNRLHYNLYTDSGYGTVWGLNTVSGTTSALTGNASHTVYGRIPANQTTVVPASYSDTILVTITF